MPYFFNGKRLAVTYAQSGPLTAQAIYDRARALGASYVLVARELHADGNPHFHAAIEFPVETKLRATDLDILGRHPNLQKARMWKKWQDYCKKHGDWQHWRKHADGWAEEPKELEDEEPALGIFEQCRACESKERWIEYCIENKISFQYCDTIWTMCTTDDPFTIRADVDLSDRQCAALRGFRFAFEGNTSLIIEGPTGCGKTSWAKQHAPKPALFVRHLDDLRNLRSEHKCIIFDDLCFTHMPRTQQLYLVDRYDLAAIHCRYKVAHIPANMPRIFTCNPGYEPVNRGDPAIARRCYKVTVRELDHMFHE